MTTEIKESDWRGILAVIITAGTFTLVGLEFFLNHTTSLAGYLLTLDATVIGYYFGSKTGEKA